MAYGPPLCDYCYTPIPLGKPVFPCISCDDMNYCDTSCQFQDSEKHMHICSENRPTIGSTLTGLEELRGAIDAFVTPRHHVLAPTALRAILRPSRIKAEERTLDTHYFQLEFIPAQDSVRLFSASIQPLTKLYAQSHNGDQQRAALIQYAQRYREQYEAAGADIAGTLFIQSRCPSVLGQSNDVTPVTIVRWLVEQVKAQPSLEPGWEESFVARMNEKV